MRSVIFIGLVAILCFSDARHLNKRNNAAYGDEVAPPKVEVEAVVKPAPAPEEQPPAEVAQPTAAPEAEPDVQASGYRKKRNNAAYGDEVAPPKVEAIVEPAPAPEEQPPAEVSQPTAAPEAEPEVQASGYRKKRNNAAYGDEVAPPKVEVEAVEKPAPAPEEQPPAEVSQPTAAPEAEPEVQASGYRMKRNNAAYGDEVAPPKVEAIAEPAPAPEEQPPAEVSQPTAAPEAEPEVQASGYRRKRNNAAYGDEVAPPKVEGVAEPAQAPAPVEQPAVEVAQPVAAPAAEPEVQASGY